MANRKKIIIITPIVVILLIMAILIIMMSGSSNNDISPLVRADEQELSGRRLDISFSYDKVKIIASSQFAFWIEDMDGNYVDTLYVTQWTSQGGYRRRPTSISQWVAAAQPANMQQSEIDIISGATPSPGDYFVSWNFTDRNGNFVTGTQYRYFIEATMNFNEHVVFTGIISIDESLSYNPTPIFNPPDTKFHNMITNVRVAYLSN